MVPPRWQGGSGCGAGGRVRVLQAPPSTPSVSGFGQGVSAAGDRLFGSADILSDSPSRHIRVPLSANPRPRCRLGTSLP
ncbi:hypothetical protein XarCFBP6762_07975 [Xanthomonas arboricola]|nr:hypothetical protein XarCFBP6762_07975 [Xanthomonas arboricola]